MRRSAYWLRLLVVTLLLIDYLQQLPRNNIYISACIRISVLESHDARETTTKGIEQ